MSAPAVLAWPQSAQIREFERERAVTLQQDYRIFDILPYEEVNAGTVLWDIRDNATGRTPIRGPGEPLVEAVRTGMTRFNAIPSRFGEKRTLPEEFIENSAKLGSFGEPLDVGSELDKLAAEIQYRMWNTVAYLAWRTLIDGVAYTIDKTGALVRTFSYEGLALVTPAIPWTTFATAVPIRNLQGIQESAIGTGFSFDARAKGYLNTRTLNMLLNNTNQSDIAGKRLAGLSQAISLLEVNNILSLLNLPMLVVEDSSYIETGTNEVVMHVPDGYICLVGSHSVYGQNSGSFMSTVFGGGGLGMANPGLYVDVATPVNVPKLPAVEIALNGGPQVRYSKQIQIMKVN